MLQDAIRTDDQPLARNLAIAVLLPRRVECAGTVVAACGTAPLNHVSRTVVRTHQAEQTNPTAPNPDARKPR